LIVCFGAFDINSRAVGCWNLQTGFWSLLASHLLIIILIIDMMRLTTFSAVDSE
jgi:hypothetical protein